MLSTLRGTIRAILFLTWTLILVPPYLLGFWMGRWYRRPFIRLWHKSACALTGIKVKRHGLPFEGERVLLAGNHISYLDIPVLASCMDITFVAKADVASWPFFGFLAKIAQTAFIERKPSKAREQKTALKERIKNGEYLMIFPEGTSSCGEKVLPFKSSLFEMVMEDDLVHDCHIQPVTIAFSRDLHGNIVPTPQRDLFAWYGDMTLLPHLWKAFCNKGMQIDVIFHPPAKAADFANRKELATWAEDRVRYGNNYLNSTQEESFDTVGSNTCEEMI